MSMRTDEELIREMDEIMAQDSFEEHFKPAPNVRAGKNRTAVYGLRMTPEEFAKFDALAKAAGKKTLADYIRSLLNAANEGAIDAAKAEAVARVRVKTRELAAAVEKL